MNILIKATLRLLVALLFMSSMLPMFEPSPTYGNGGNIIIDHSSTNITQIPQWAIEAAKANLRIGYGHLSHGYQITNGMTGLVAFANGGGKGLSLPTDIFAWNNGGTGGALDLEEGGDYWSGPLAGAIGNPSSTDWVDETYTYLDDPSHADVNVIVWAWCNELHYFYRNNKIYDWYLTPMADLEADYPDIKFVYMTGHADHVFSDNSTYYGVGGHTEYDYDAEVKAANQMIYQYCVDNGKILYDFGDMEHYNPDGDYFPYVDEFCNYYNSADNTTWIGNWGSEWRDSHTQNVDWYDCSAFHTDALNANQKAYAAWWLWARLAGWKGVANPPENNSPVATNDDYSVDKGGTLAITAPGILTNDTDADADPLTAFKMSDPAHGSLTLNPDGSFTYIHDGSETTSDSFTYKVHDGYIDSGVATVSITVNPPVTISITITDAGTQGVLFGSMNPGDNDKLDTDAGFGTPSIVVTNDAGSTTNVTLQIKGSDFDTGTATFAVTNAKYSTTYEGAKTALSTSYATFAIDVAPGANATLWHWLDIPSSGVTAGTYTSTFSYKAIAP